MLDFISESLGIGSSEQIGNQAEPSAYDCASVLESTPNEYPNAKKSYFGMPAIAILNFAETRSLSGCFVFIS